jgi:hypothetical protein
VIAEVFAARDRTSQQVPQIEVELVDTIFEISFSRAPVSLAHIIWSSGKICNLILNFVAYILLLE